MKPRFNIYPLVVARTFRRAYFLVALDISKGQKCKHPIGTHLKCYYVTSLGTVKEMNREQTTVWFDDFKDNEIIVVGIITEPWIPSLKRKTNGVTCRSVSCFDLTPVHQNPGKTSTKPSETLSSYGRFEGVSSSLTPHPRWAETFGQPRGGPQKTRRQLTRTGDYRV